MNLAYYGTPDFEDGIFDDPDTFIDDAAERNQRIADRKAELIAEVMSGKDAAFWRDEECSLAVSLAARDFILRKADQATLGQFVGAITAEIDRYAQGLAEGEESE